MAIEILGVSDSQLRFASFALIFVAMALLETWLPRRKRAQPRLKRWTANVGLLISDFAAVSLVTVLIPVTALIAAIWAAENGVGLFNVVALPGWLAAILAFIILDFTIWAQHWVTHKVPLLWRIHRVHHSDQELDASSAVRFHPLEILLSILIKAAVVVAIGADPVIVVIFEAAVNGAAIFNHANLRLPLPLDRALRPFIVTPDMHRVHHSITRRETDSNYGFLLSVWDRLFRVYNDQPEKGHDGMTIGLEQHQKNDSPSRLGWVLLFPFRK